MSWKSSWLLGICAAFLILSGEAGAVPRNKPAAIPTRKAAVLRAGGPGWTNLIAAQLKAAGYEAEWIDYEALIDPDSFNASPYELLVLAPAGALPVEAAPVIDSFVRKGGDVLALGAPLWSRPLANVNGNWKPLSEIKDVLSRQKPVHLLFDFETEAGEAWKRETNQPDQEAARELVPVEKAGAALHVVIPDLTNWDTLLVPAKGFARQDSLTCFRAKGGPDTSRLAVEWREKDGSRWIASVPLTSEWRDYALPPSAFQAWDPPAGRGGRGDRLNVEKVQYFSVGLALTHTFKKGRQEYWIDDIGTAPDPLAGAPLPEAPQLHLEALSPGYLFYPITTLSTAATKFGAVSIPAGTLALHPRPNGAGFNQYKPGRWESLLEARDAASGDYRGAVGVLLVHRALPYRGSLCAAFTPTNPSFYEQQPVKKLLQDTLQRMNRGIFLLEGGGEWFTAFEDQEIPFGARAANFGHAPAEDLAVKVVVSPAEPEKNPESFAQEWKLDLPAGREAIQEESWKPKQWPKAGFTVTTELTSAGKTIDRLSHRLQVARPKPSPDFIRVAGGEFLQDKKRWKPHGINYMPSSGIGLKNHNLFEYWLGRGAYDPEIVERDLLRIKALGFNSVSIFIYHESLKAQHLLDFLRLCEEMNLKVNLSLRPGTPLDFQWDKMRAIIEHYRLSRNDTVFAYDLAWEPHHGDYAFQKKNYRDAWEKWVLKRHGSIESAEKFWSFPYPSNGIPPLRRKMKADRLKIVNDYRTFLDDLLGEKYAEARRLVLSIDPNHAVSFRMKSAGDPTFHDERMMPYDFYGLRNAVDIWEPEAYGRIGDWPRVREGIFTAAYARLCDPQKPVLWAEAGFDVWDPLRMDEDAAKFARAADFYADFYRMLSESDADGVFYWWYAGGCRVDEKSDFGILNPDGTDRPVTAVIREKGLLFVAAQKQAAPNIWMEVDRDATTGGFAGIYEAVKREFWRAIEGGKTPGLKWKKQPGTENAS